jgi:putative phage-type endonuclease
LTSKLRQRSAEWHAARRSLITSTDIPIILGLSPYKAEGQLAREKSGEAEDQPPNLAMRIGQAMEPVIQAEYELMTGKHLTRYRGLVVSKRIPWAAASPDCRRSGERYLVELKDTRARRWDSGELPRDVEAQVQWQLGCTGFPEADVAALRWSNLELFHVAYDADMFDGLVVIAEDFRTRMAAGGPFSENKESLRRRFPNDDGEEIVADAATSKLVGVLLALKTQAKTTEDAIEAVENQIKQHMATAARMQGTGWHISWKRGKDITEVNYRNIAEGVLNALDDGPREAILSLNTTVRAGVRPFRVTEEKSQ